MLTDFAHWYPLTEAASHAPAASGVYQVKVLGGLIEYPSGKSAMICYGSAANLQEAVAEVARLHPNAKFLCRHQVSTAPAVLLEFVLGQFVRRFGVAPAWPASWPLEPNEAGINS